jgi:hypothetical protein
MWGCRVRVVQSVPHPARPDLLLMSRQANNELTWGRQRFLASLSVLGGVAIHWTLHVRISLASLG